MRFTAPFPGSSSGADRTALVRPASLAPRYLVSSPWDARFARNPSRRPTACQQLGCWQSGRSRTLRLCRGSRFVAARAVSYRLLVGRVAQVAEKCDLEATAQATRLVVRESYASKGGRF